MSELKKCPFCGSEVKWCGLVHDKSQRFHHPEIKSSMCPKCWCQGFIKLES